MPGGAEMAVDETIVDDDPAPDAGTDGHQGEVRCPGGRAEPVFGGGQRAHVVLDDGPEPGPFLDQPAYRYVVPTQERGPGDDLGLWVDRPGQADANCGDQRIGGLFGEHGVGNLVDRGLNRDGRQIDSAVGEHGTAHVGANQVDLTGQKFDAYE